MCHFYFILFLNHSTYYYHHHYTFSGGGTQAFSLLLILLLLLLLSYALVDPSTCFVRRGGRPGVAARGRSLSSPSSPQGGPAQQRAPQWGRAPPPPTAAAAASGPAATADHVVLVSGEGSAPGLWPAPPSVYRDHRHWWWRDHGDHEYVVARTPLRPPACFDGKTARLCRRRRFSSTRLREQGAARRRRRRPPPPPRQ